MRPQRFAVIPTHNRPESLSRCIDAIHYQVDDVLIIDNASDPPVLPTLGVQVLHVPTQPPNLSHLWNLGIEWAANQARQDWQDWSVAILNDDAIVPMGWYGELEQAMARAVARAACSSPFDGPLQWFGPGTAPSVNTRLTGWAFVLQGGDIRADEQFQWLCGDDDLSMQCREAGGIVHVPGVPVEHLYPDQSTRGVLAEIGAQDMQRFVDKWGRRPW